MLEVQENALLDISYIGFKSQQLKVQKGGKALSVILKEDSELLDEVVVIGYGTQRKGEVASSIATVKSENFLKVPSPDAAQMIRVTSSGTSCYNPRCQSSFFFPIIFAWYHNIRAKHHSVNSHRWNSWSIKFCFS